MAAVVRVQFLPARSWSLTHLYPLYTVVAALLIASAVPLASGAVFGDVQPASAAPVEPRAEAKPVVVVSSSQAVRTPPPVTRAPAAQSGDQRWWTEQLARITSSTSVVRRPAPQQKPPPPLAQPILAPAPPPDALVEPVEQTVSIETTTFANQPLGAAVPARIRRWETLIQRAAQKYDVDPNLIAALMLTESGGEPNAVSPANAIGLMQVLNGPTDPATNVDRGVAILVENIHRFQAIDLALAGYNAGPAAVLMHGGVPPYAETQAHISRTLSSYLAFRSA